MPLDLTHQRGLLFRITHVANLPWLLSNGLHSANGGIVAPNFVGIGNPDLIAGRARRLAPIPPGGTLGDYVPFYFTPKSPMLLNIKTGYNGVTRRANAEIAILVSSCQAVAGHGVTMLFTDRHAYTATARWTDNRADLAAMIDWDILSRHDFARSDAYPDKMERYQARRPKAHACAFGRLAWNRMPLAYCEGRDRGPYTGRGADASGVRSSRVVFLMIRYAQGNLLAADVEALVNTVNTVGVSGKGIALMFKEAFADNFKAYEAAAKAGRVTVGDMFVTERHDMLGPRVIINFPTKQHWRNPSRLEWIELGLTALRREITARGIRSIAIPPLGAGNGGLAWGDVRPLIERALAGLDADVVVYEPTASYQNVVKRHGVETLTPARALMAEMIRRYAVLGFECSLLEAQKLAWFLAVGAERFGLANPIADDFAANRYGPYSDKVRHLLDSLDGSYIACETRIADAKPFDPIRFRDERRDKVAAYLTTDGAKALRPALDHATQVIEGFQSPFGLELLATVDWLNRRVGVGLEAMAMQAAVRRWPGPPGSAERKAKIFGAREIGIAIDHLKCVDAALGG